MECMRFPTSAVSFDSEGRHGVDYRLEAYLAHVIYQTDFGFLIFQNKGPMVFI